MKVDVFTKVLLTLICIFLGIIAFRPFLKIDYAFAASNEKFSHVQVIKGDGFDLLIFDESSGKIWNYQLLGSGSSYDSPYCFQQLVQLGQPFKKVE